MQKMPDIVLKRKRLSKTKTVVIFRRNNLSFMDFIKAESGYIYEESFRHHDISGTIKVFVDSDNLYELFSVDTKSTKVKGGKDHLGIFLRLQNQKLPIEEKRSVGCIRFELDCAGGKLYYDGKKKKKRISGVELHNRPNKNAYSAPASVSWAAAHPLQGGGFNPK